MQITKSVFFKTGRTAHRYLRSFCCYIYKWFQLLSVVLSCSIKYVLVIYPVSVVMSRQTSMAHKIMLRLASQAKTSVKKGLPFTSGNVTPLLRNLCAGGHDHDMSIIIGISLYLMLCTGRNHMFPYFWNVAETWNSTISLYLRLAET